MSATLKPALPTGVRLRVLLACSRASGGYAPEQIRERFGDVGMDAVRYLSRCGWLALAVEHDRYLRTAAGDAACPSRRQLAGLEAAAAPVPSSRAERGVALVKMLGRATSTRIADELGVQVNNVASIMRRAVERGDVVLTTVKAPGKRERAFYCAPDDDMEAA